jgi:tRNA-dihydrouridine synthase
MNQSYENLYERLDGGLFLSALHEYTFGAYCAMRSRGCAMVQTGLYFAEPEAEAAVRQRYGNTFLPTETEACRAFLVQDCRQARSAGDVVVCMNLGALSLEPGLQAAELFLEAGGDLVELNIHGGFIRYMQAGRMRAMIFPENQSELLRWLDEYNQRGIPLIVKFSARDQRQNLIKLLQKIDRCGLFGVHVNIRSEETSLPDLRLIEEVRQVYHGFLLVSGYIRSARQVKECFEAGANMAGIGEPVMREAEFIGRLAEKLGKAAR